MLGITGVTVRQVLGVRELLAQGLLSEALSLALSKFLAEGFQYAAMEAVYEELHHNGLDVSEAEHQEAWTILTQSPGDWNQSKTLSRIVAAAVQAKHLGVLILAQKDSSALYFSQQINESDRQWHEISI